MPVTGGCRCGACRYSLDYPAIPVIYACHCRDCQTATGGGFVLQAMIPEARLSVTGERVDRSAPNSRGAVTTQVYCTQCLTRLYSTNTGRPGIVLVRAGTLDNCDTIVPAVHMWASRRQPWIGLSSDAEAYDGAIPVDRIMQVFAPNFA